MATSIRWFPTLRANFRWLKSRERERERRILDFGLLSGGASGFECPHVDYYSV
jgi:hypothetical protein